MDKAKREAKSHFPCELQRAKQSESESKYWTFITTNTTPKGCENKPRFANTNVNLLKNGNMLIIVFFAPKWTKWFKVMESLRSWFQENIPKAIIFLKRTVSVQMV